MKTTGYEQTHNRFLNSNLQQKMVVIQETPSSSNISRIAHNGESGVLYVEFRSGKTYRYEDVSPDTWNAFIEAPSVGNFFHARIKDAYKSALVDKIPA
jgi:hypothetical protein